MNSVPVVTEIILKDPSDITFTSCSRLGTDLTGFRFPSGFQVPFAYGEKWVVAGPGILHKFKLSCDDIDEALE